MRSRILSIVFVLHKVSHKSLEGRERELIIFLGCTILLKQSWVPRETCFDMFTCLWSYEESVHLICSFMQMPTTNQTSHASYQTGFPSAIKHVSFFPCVFDLYSEYCSILFTSNTTQNFGWWVFRLGWYSGVLNDGLHAFCLHYVWLFSNIR